MRVGRLSARLAAATGVVAFAVVGHHASAATQMFKCIVAGRTIYQQQACPVTAEPPASATASGAIPGAASAATESSAARKIKPASRAASAAPATRP
jgi:hypothetical protein